MKTIYTLSTMLLIALSLNAFADDKAKSNKESSSVSVAPFVWGNPESEAPVELRTLKAKNAFVPVAPFVWGNPENAVRIEEDKNLRVPVAPFIYGDPDSDAPAGLELIKAVHADVPVAPFVLGNPETDAPGEIIILY